MIAVINQSTVALLVMAWLVTHSSADDAVDTPVELEVAEHWPIDYPTYHVQGLCVSDDFFWVSSVQRDGEAGWVYRVDRKSLKVLQAQRVDIAAQYHPGGMQLRDGDLWVPLAEYRRRSTSTILRLDAMTLAVKSSFPVADHIGGVAVDDGGNVFAANWDCRQIYLFNKDGKPGHEGRGRAKVDSPTGVAYQDLEWHDGRLVGTGRARVNGRQVGVVDVMDTATWQHVARYILAGKTRTGGTNFGREGFCQWRGSFYLMPEDGPHTTVYRFALPGG